MKCMDLLKPDGELVFICSDTFLTINTMRGLRKVLMTAADVRVESLPDLFDETNHPMVLCAAQDPESRRNCVGGWEAAAPGGNRANR